MSGQMHVPRNLYALSGNDFRGGEGLKGVLNITHREIFRAASKSRKQNQNQT